MEFMIDNSNAQNDNRIIYLSSDVSNSSISDVSEKILSYNEQDRKGIDTYKKYIVKPIHLYVQSFGGSVYDMWALIDIIESSETPIITYCAGYCMSAAADIYLAGHYRYMYKNAFLMIHQMSVMNFGKYNDTQVDQKQYELMHKRSIKFLKKRTNLPKKIYNRYDKLKEDIYLTSKECLKYGICDKIIEPSDMRNIIIEQLAELPPEEDMCCCEE